MLGHFLRELFAAANAGHVTLWDRKTKGSTHIPVGDLARAEAEAARIDASGHDVYVAAGLRTDDLGSGKRGTDEEVAALPGIWVDIDLQSPAHKATNLPATWEDASKILEGAPPPTLVVDTGHGLHVWWLFDAPVPISGPGMRADLRKLLKDSQKVLQKRAAAYGWKVDDTADLSRVLRLPGTSNHKVSGDTRPVVLLVDDGPRYIPSTLAPLFTAPPAPPATVLPSVAQVPSPPAPTPAPGVGGEGTVLGRTIERLRNLRARESRAIVAKVLKGESFADKGERDKQLQRVASIVAFVEPDAPAEELAEILRPSLEKMAEGDDDPENPPPSIDDAVAKIERAQQEAQQQREERKQKDEAIKRGLIKSARGATGVRSAPPPVAQVQTPSQPPTTPVQPPTQGGADAAPPFTPSDPEVAPYSDDEIKLFAATYAGGDVDTLSRRWVIQKATSFYVLVNGRYQPPITRDELDVSLPRDLAPAPIDWNVMTVKGGLRRKTVNEILRDHCTVARHLEADLSLQASYYDEATQTLREAVCPLRPLPAVFDSAVDQWLRLLGGSEVDKLLDWIATATLLQYQSCALYLAGRAGTGKSMLAHGLARLWTVGAPTDLSRILDNFNADLARCPLVFADEALPSSFKGQRTSAELRQLVGSSSRTLARKFQANANLLGALRLMLCANNDRMLALDEDLGIADLEAVAGRFLYIETPQAAADFLERLGGRVGTKGWVDDDIIAKHAMWLMENRQVKHGNRFVVEGHATKMHRNLATEGRIPSLVVEWLARFLDQPHSSPIQTKTVVVGNGQLLVNTTALTKFWGTYIATERDGTPSTTRLGRALGNLAKGEKRVGGARYHEIDTDIVYDWAEKNQVGDVDKMKEVVRSLTAPAVQPPTITLGKKAKP